MNLKFPLSLDLRRESLSQAAAGVAVIDDDKRVVMRILAAPDGTYDHAGAVVDTLNAVDLLRQESAKL